MKSSLVLIVLGFMLLTGCANSTKQDIPALRISAEVSHGKALKAIHAGDVEGAALWWSQALLQYQALDDWPGQGMARLGLAQAQHKAGQVDRAIQTLKPMVAQSGFMVAQRAQAHLQLAQLWLSDDQNAGVAAMHLAQSEQLCAAPCQMRWAQINVAAKIALLNEDWPRVMQLTVSVLAGAAEGEEMEIAHSHQLQAQAQLAQLQLAGALYSIDQALALDRKLARPDWLLADYRVRLQIVQLLSDREQITLTEQKISSLCEALRCNR